MNIALPPLPAAFVPALLSLLLAGCATGGSDARTHQAAMGSSDTRGGTQSQQGMPMDMQAMCDMHKPQMAGKSPQERQAMMDERMRSMSPEMRSRMQSMMEQCR